MKKIVCMLVVTFISMLAGADNFPLGVEREAKEAERLLELSGTKEAMDQMTDMVIAQQLQKNPTLVPFESVMRRFFEKYLSFESTKDELVELYVEMFTENELVALNDFYSTDVGRKAIETMPNLMQRGSEIGARRAQENMAEFQKMIAEEADRLRQLGQQ